MEAEGVIGKTITELILSMLTASLADLVSKGFQVISKTSYEILSYLLDG